MLHRQTEPAGAGDFVGEKKRGLEALLAFADRSHAGRYRVIALPADTLHRCSSSSSRSPHSPRRKRGPNLCGFV